MKKLILLISGIFLLGMAGMAFAEFSSRTSELSVSDPLQVDEDVCDLSKRTKISFADYNKTTFLVPDVYLYKPYPHYEPKTEKTSYAAFYARQKDLSPNCKKYSDNAIDNRLIFLIHPTNKNSFDDLLKFHMQWSPEEVRKTSDFAIYRKKKSLPENEWSATKDFLVPLDGAYSKAIFFSCAKGLHPISVDALEGCQAYSKLSDDLYMQYNTHSVNLVNYKAIDGEIKNLIKSFQISPTMMDGDP